MGNYKLTETAEADLYRIWLYGLEHWGLNKADSYIKALFDRFGELADNPFQYSGVDEI